MAKEIGLPAKAVIGMIDLYRKTLQFVASEISSTEPEQDLFDPFFIEQKVNEIDRKILSGSSDALLSQKLFYESMIHSPKECEKTYHKIRTHDDFIKFGFSAICYYYKKEYDWAMKNLSQYYSVPRTDKHPLLLLIYAKLHYERGNLSEAKLAAVLAIESAPCSLDGHKLLYEIYTKQNRPTEASIEQQIITMLIGQKGDDVS